MSNRFWQRLRVRAPSVIDFGGSLWFPRVVGQSDGLARLAKPAQLPSRAGVVGPDMRYTVLALWACVGLELAGGLTMGFAAFKSRRVVVDVQRQPQRTWGDTELRRAIVPKVL